MDYPELDELYDSHAEALFRYLCSMVDLEHEVRDLQSRLFGRHRSASIDGRHLVDVSKSSHHLRATRPLTPATTSGFIPSPGTSSTTVVSTPTAKTGRRATGFGSVREDLCMQPNLWSLERSCARPLTLRQSQADRP